MTESRTKILIVDDERLNIRMLDEILRDEYDISVAVNGEQALKRALAAPPPDMILLDIQMPGMDGYEVCRRLMAHETTRGIPVIFVTSMVDEEDERKGLELGAVDYITKPFRPSIVQARLKNHLELKRQRDLLNRLSSLDGLTGIANRRHFETFIEQEWRRAPRHGLEISLILMDIDHFKKYNDHYGHTAGDDCLKEVARALVDALPRATDLIARYGGEEFVCVLPATDLQGALKVAERLRAAVLSQAIPHAFSGTHDCVTLSLGVACMQPGRGSTTPSDLIVAADRMLYRAKEAGRNRVMATETGDATPRPARKNADAAGDAQACKPRVLIVDDEPVNINVLHAILRDDYETFAARSGEQALQRAVASPRPDVILLDVQMPGMNGYEVCRRLKADPRTRDVPVLFTTLKPNEEDEKAGLAAGAADYIAKPFRPSIAAARVGTHLRQRQLLATLEEKNATLEEMLNLRESIERITRPDLKRPLGRIIEHAARSGADAALSAGGRETLRRIEGEAFGMLETISRTLDLWRLERHNYPLTAAPVDLLRVIGRIAADAADHRSAVSILFNDAPANVDDRFVIQGDAWLCHSMLANLIRNALEASPPGAPITVALCQASDRKQVVIHNQGVIPVEIRGRFFDKGVTAGKKGGSGLGAYTARLVAETLGASIRVDTCDEAGTSVTIDFPT